MAKCILLSRVSTGYQSLDSQTQAIKNEAIRNGFKESDMIIIEDKESAIKLSEEERNGLNRMKDEIEHDKDITHLFIYELSRLSRRQLVLFSIRDYLIERNIQLVCCTPYFRLLEDGKLSQTANLVFSIFASMAESEMNLKQERFKRGKQRNKLNGKAIGRVLYGYTTLEDKTIIVDEDKEEFVTDVFKMYATGMYSVVSLARELVDKYGDIKDNPKSMKGRIMHMLYDKRYCGDKQYPQIISEELFNKCREVGKQNTINNKHHIKDTALLKRIIYSKDTGFHLTFNGNIKGNRYISAHQKPRVTIMVDIIDPIIWNFAVILHKQYVMDSAKIRKQLQEKIDSATQKMVNLKVNTKKIDEKIDKTEERLIFGSLRQEKADALIAELNKSKKYNENECTKLSEEISNMTKLLESKTLEELPEYDSFSIDQKIDLIRQMISRVEISREGYYKITAYVYTNVDSFLYMFNIDTWNKVSTMSSKMLV